MDRQGRRRLVSGKTYDSLAGLYHITITLSGLIKLRVKREELHAWTLEADAEVLLENVPNRYDIKTHK